MNDAVDHVMPDGPWEFDAEVARVFDNMIRRSIPDYTTMRDLVETLAVAYMRPESTVYDLGVATGEGIVRLLTYAPKSTAFVGIDNSPEMLARAKERLGFTSCVQLIEHDLSLGLPGPQPMAPASLVVDVLTTHFIEPAERYDLLRQVYGLLVPGGAFITVAKVKPPRRFDRLFTERYHAFKAAQGYSQEEIAAKARALEGVLIPVSTAWLGRCLHEVGFTEYECFWRWLNFAGIVAVKT